MRGPAMASGFVYSPDHDIYDGAPWTEEDLAELRRVIGRGGSIEDAAELICRQGTIDEVRAKAEELGLTVRKDGK